MPRGRRQRNEPAQIRRDSAGRGRSLTKLPTLTGRELVRALGKTGFEVVRVKGSHPFLRHADGRTTVVPVHRGETMGPGLMSKILRDCELDKKDLSELL